MGEQGHTAEAEGDAPHHCNAFWGTPMLVDRGFRGLQVLRQRQQLERRRFRQHRASAGIYSCGLAQSEGDRPNKARASDIVRL